METDLNKFEPSPPDSPRRAGRLSPRTARIKELSWSPTNKEDLICEILKSAKKTPLKPLSKPPPERSMRLKNVVDISERLKDMTKK
jgi:hypothetical protein